MFNQSYIEAALIKRQPVNTPRNTSKQANEIIIICPDLLKKDMPVQYLCLVCSRAVRNNSLAICCDGGVIFALAQALQTSVITKQLKKIWRFHGCVKASLTRRYRMQMYCRVENLLDCHLTFIPWMIPQSRDYASGHPAMLFSNLLFPALAT